MTIHEARWFECFQPFKASINEVQELLFRDVLMNLVPESINEDIIHRAIE